jgi:hypothetical protein
VSATLGLDRIIKHPIRVRDAARSAQRPDEGGVRWRLELRPSRRHGLVHLDGLVQLLVLAEAHEQRVVGALVGLAPLAMHLLEQLQHPKNTKARVHIST